MNHKPLKTFLCKWWSIKHSLFVVYFSKDCTTFNFWRSICMDRVEAEWKRKLPAPASTKNCRFHRFRFQKKTKSTQHYTWQSSRTKSWKLHTKYRNKKRLGLTFVPVNNNSMIPPQTTKQSKRLKVELKYFSRPCAYILTSISRVNMPRSTLLAKPGQNIDHFHLNVLKMYSKSIFGVRLLFELWA